MADKVRVAVAGAGYWGINHVRAFSQLAGAELVMICEPDDKQRSRALAMAPRARGVRDLEEALAADDVDAVVLATPARLHAEQSLAALAAHKHVFVEKPMALNVPDATRVADAARASDRHLLVGHLMLHHPVVARLKQMIDGGEVGEVYYLYAVRVNLGRLRTDENALFSLGPHDVSMVLHLLGQEPVEVSAHGHGYLQNGVEDVVFLHLTFADGHPSEKLRVYDKGYDRPPEFSSFAQYLTLRQGDIHIPRVDMAEPLTLQCRHFIECAAGRAQPLCPADEGRKVVRVLAMAEASLAAGGAVVNAASFSRH